VIRVAFKTPLKTRLQIYIYKTSQQHQQTLLVHTKLSFRNFTTKLRPRAFVSVGKCIARKCTKHPQANLTGLKTQLLERFVIEYPKSQSGSVFFRPA